MSGATAAQFEAAIAAVENELTALGLQIGEQAEVLDEMERRRIGLEQKRSVLKQSMVDRFGAAPAPALREAQGGTR